jgi:hypothetical protein
MVRSHRLVELFQQAQLAFQDFPSRQIDLEPPGSVYFRKFPQLAGSGWPFDGKGVALDCRSLNVTLHCPRMHDLSAFLPKRLQGLILSLGD